MAERFLEALMNDEVISSSLSQIGLLSLIVIVSFFLERSIEKSFEKQERNKKEEVYVCDDVLTTGLVSIFAFIISSLLLFGGNIPCLSENFDNIDGDIFLIFS